MKAARYRNTWCFSMFTNTAYNFAIKLVLYLFISVWCVSIEDYCKTDEKNTPCQTYCRRSSRCGNTGTEFEVFTDEERLRALAKHNEFRNGVAAGDYTAFNLPRAPGGINVMSYDKEAEFVAACHIKWCTKTHDKRRLTSTGVKMGQNIYSTYTSAPVEWSTTFIEDGIQAWFAEHRALTADITKKYKYHDDYYQFTQLIWSESTRVGCAKMHSLERKSHKLSLTCDYIPTGNIKDKPVYSDATCENFNKIYTALCGESRLLSEDKYEPPLDLNKGHHHANTVLYLFTSLVSLSFILG